MKTTARGGVACGELLRPLTRGAIVELVWWDSIGRHGWTPASEIDQWAEEVSGADHRSAGYFFAVTDHTVTLVQSMADYDGDDHQVDHILAIPLVAVRQARVLRAGPRPT